MNKEDIDRTVEAWKKKYGLDNVGILSADIIDSAESFNDKIIKRYMLPNADDKKSKYVFRGLSIAEQKYSTLTRLIYRNAIKYDKTDEKFCHAFNNELLYIRKFEQNDALDLPGVKTVTDLIAAAQHYSIRTRFIDWTTSPLVATLFALYNSKEALVGKNKKEPYYYLLLVVDASKHIMAEALPTPDFKQAGICGTPEESYITYGMMLKELMDIYFGLEKLKTAKDISEREKIKIKNNAKNYFRRLFKETNTTAILKANSVKNNAEAYYKKLCENKMFFIKTNFANTRIVNQRGLFQIAVDPNKAYIDNCFKYIDCYFINSEARKNIIKLCENLGFNYYGLMPDSQSIAQSINREIDKLQ